MESDLKLFSLTEHMPNTVIKLNSSRYLNYSSLIITNIVYRYYLKLHTKTKKKKNTLYSEIRRAILYHRNYVQTL